MKNLLITTALIVSATTASAQDATTNARQIAVNTGNIIANGAAIATLMGSSNPDMAGMFTDVANNARGVADVQAYASANRSGLAGNYEAIGVNASAIEANATATEDALNANRRSILGSNSMAAAALNTAQGNTNAIEELAARPSGVDGTDGTNGEDGAEGARGADGTDGVDGEKGDTGRAAVAPLGSLSFAAASASFYGDGVGFGLSASNYSSLEGSVVFGFDLGNDWRVVAGVTTDFKGRIAGSVAVGVSF